MNCERCGEDTHVQRYEVDGFTGHLCEACMDVWDATPPANNAPLQGCLQWPTILFTAQEPVVRERFIDMLINDTLDAAWLIALSALEADTGRTKNEPQAAGVCEWFTTPLL